MPNTKPPIINSENYALESKLAAAGAKCDYGLFLAATADNAETVAKIAKTNRVMGLKMYLNNTFGDLCLPNVTDWMKHFEHWPKNVPICVHAEGETTSAIIGLAHLYDRYVHICHVAREEEILIIKLAKEKGVKVTCEVAPHHLFLSEEDVDSIGQKRSEVKPNLVSLRDQKALWDNMDVIDVFASDHAPHLKSEKDGPNSPPGFPGLETTLPLLLTAVKNGRLKIDDLWKKMYWNPKRIFNLPDQSDTYIEVDMDEEWVIPEAMPFSKAQWTPFTGRSVIGRVRRVVLRNEVVFVDTKVLVSPGFGQNIFKTSTQNSAENIFDFDFIESTSTEETGIERRKKETEIYSEMLKELEIQNKQPLSVAITGTPSTSGVKVVPMPSPALFSDHKLCRHVLSVDDFNREQLHELFNLAHKMKICVTNEKPLEMTDKIKIPIQDILRGKLMASIFYEVSTRTSSSFAAAMQRLGGSVIYFNKEFSSVQKGETVEDTVNIMANAADVAVLRHPEKGTVARVAYKCNKPVINAGDGVGEHPTQALLDAFTIREEIGTINHLTVIKTKMNYFYFLIYCHSLQITLVGDLANGRTVHSLARLLAHYKLTLLQLVSPTSLRMPEEVKNYLSSKDIKYIEMTSLEDALPETDVLYMTRIQRERFANREDYEACYGHYVVTPQLMTIAKTKMIVMHPLPRLNEIESVIQYLTNFLTIIQKFLLFIRLMFYFFCFRPDFDEDKRAVYFKQAENGVYVRMALLAMVLGKL